MIPFKSVRVGPFDVSIEKLEGGEREKCLGMFSEEHMTIKIRESFTSKHIEAETLLHEVLHSVYAIMGVQQKDPEEKVVRQISTGMAMVIRDNPKLIAWLKERLS